MKVTLSRQVASRESWFVLRHSHLSQPFSGVTRTECDIILHTLKSSQVFLPLKLDSSDKSIAEVTDIQVFGIKGTMSVWIPLPNVFSSWVEVMVF